MSFEEALQRAGRRYSHPGITGVVGETYFSEGDGPAIPLFKLHGSSNWWTLHSTPGSASLEEARLSTRPLKVLDGGAAQTYATSVVETRPNLLLSLENDPGYGMPVVAVYGTGKRLPWNREHIHTHRVACFDEIFGLDSAEVVVAGLRPVPRRDDRVLWKLLSALGQRWLSRERRTALRKVSLLGRDYRDSCSDILRVAPPRAGAERGAHAPAVRSVAAASDLGPALGPTRL